MTKRRDFLVHTALPALLVTPGIAAADSTGKFTSKVEVVPVISESLASSRSRLSMRGNVMISCSVQHLTL